LEATSIRGDWGTFVAGGTTLGATGGAVDLATIQVLVQRAERQLETLRAKGLRVSRPAPPTSLGNALRALADAMDELEAIRRLR
jgi:hypothetical protein